MTVTISVIIPVYNEEENVRPLCKSVDRELKLLEIDYEIILVDDGSTDNTFAIASRLSEKYSAIKVIRLRRNYGQTPAMAAGIDAAEGRILITMDGDLQNDPADFHRFIEKLQEGYDIVVGWRHKRQDKLISRKIPSRVANWIIGKVTGVPVKDNGCSLKAYRSEIIKNVPLYSEMHRFIPAMTSMTGAKIAEIKVRHHARRFGISKYGLSRMYKVILDLVAIKTITAFSSRPLVWFTTLALPAAAASAGLLIYSIWQLILRDSPFPLPIAGTGVLLGALAFILLLGGLVCELIYKTGNVEDARFSSLTTKVVECQD